MTDLPHQRRLFDWPVARFLVIGSLGFIVDASVLLVLILCGGDAYVSRLISFAAAVIVTWWGNRTWTFRERVDQPKYKELSAYFLVQTCGAGINYGIYALVLFWIGTSPLQVLVALACGSVTALFFNFFGAKNAVFHSGSH
ncbi:GtrA-like protein [Roseovarius albus]|uniref:GtrA-like protein n=1 Tax=Roseovarius albus TaxID=1247867 RepID=A0A1X6ZKQ0_9RHOB|nr:GtrA family protein [Roseovarius albus]SLN53946.1 GtrA-like protein [Roseovarius albus]